MNAISETWRPVVGWEDSHEVSTFGRLRSVERVVHAADGRTIRYASRLFAPKPSANGYIYAKLRYGSKCLLRTVHSLVAAAFLGPRPDGADVCHLDHDKQNNCASNLKYDTRSENMLDSYADGRLPVGDAHPNARLTAEDVVAIRASTEAQRVLANRYGVCQQTISDVKRFKRRKHEVPA